MFASIEYTSEVAISVEFDEHIVPEARAADLVQEDRQASRRSQAISLLDDHNLPHLRPEL